MDRKEIAAILNKISILYELKGESFFKVRAYQMAARAIEVSAVDITKNTTMDELLAIDGVGKSIAGQILSLAKDGSLKLYDELNNSTPPGLIEMLKIPKLGTKKIRYLYDSLGIQNISELERACRENKLLCLTNFGKKTQDNILHGIDMISKFKDRFLYAEVISEATEIETELKRHRSVKRCSIAGSLRRRKEIIKDIDIVAGTDDPGDVMEFFINLEQVSEIIAKGDTKSTIRLKSGISADIRTVADFEYPYALHHFTGSKEHNTAMRSLAKKHGIKMNEYGLFNGDRLIKCYSEKEIFAVFGMDYIEPELRENNGEIETAQKNRLPELVEPKDIKGLFHFHTASSDGSMDLEQVVGQLKVMGFEYCGIADHSKTARYAGGIPDAGIEAYLSGIDRVNEKFPDFKIFKGIESDILPDGSLDYSDEILERFDFVIIAVHSNFNMDRTRMTERIIKAINNRYATILAHPTGRLLLARDPYEVDIVKIIDAASHAGVDLEINANPFRLDLDWRHCKYAKEKQVKMFINPDAHSMEGFYDFVYGINTARKGWLEKKDIINTMGKDEVAKYFKSKKILKEKIR